MNQSHWNWLLWTFHRSSSCCWLLLLLPRIISTDDWFYHIQQDMLNFLFNGIRIHVDVGEHNGNVIDRFNEHCLTFCHCEEASSFTFPTRSNSNTVLYWLNCEWDNEFQSKWILFSVLCHCHHFYFDESGNTCQIYRQALTSANRIIFPLHQHIK